jgi:hypothetical protein
MYHGNYQIALCATCNQRATGIYLHCRAGIERRGRILAFSATVPVSDTRYR